MLPKTTLDPYVIAAQKCVELKKDRFSLLWSLFAILLAQFL